MPVLLRSRLGLLCAPLCLLAAESGGEVGFGPLRIGTQSPGQSLRLGLIPGTPSTLAPGSWSLRVGSTWANLWASKGPYALDYESLASDASLAWCFAESWQLEAGAFLRHTFGGRMDGFIQGFHRMFGIRQGGRDEVEQGRTLIHIAPTASQPGIDLDADDLGGARENHLRLTLQRNLLPGGGWLPALALAGTVQAPVGYYDQYGGSGIDVGLDLSAAKRWGSWHGYLTLACIRYGADSIYGVRLRRLNWSGLAAVEYRISDRWALLAQYLVSEGVAHDYHVFSSASHEITLGAKLAVDRRSLIEVGLLENIIIFDNSPDFGIHVGLKTVF